VSHQQELPASIDRQRLGFDHDWRFFLGQVVGGERPEFDDSTWRTLDLPHDWAIEGRFDKKNNPQMGGLELAGIGWYRKHFRLPEGPPSRRYTIEFDGAMADAHVFLNGHELGARPYGYIGFGFDITPYLHFGHVENVLAARLISEEESSRWYPGAGLYRHVWLDTTEDVHVARWGTFVTTHDVSNDSTAVVVRTEIENERPRGAEISLETVVLNADGRSVAGTMNPTHLSPNAVEVKNVQLDLARPHRWDVDDPYLYTVVSTIREGQRVLDRFSTPLGVRTLEFDKSKGLLLNGRPLKLHGVCLHHDLGALGAAVNDRAIERRLRLMKEMGANALRTSHNPPAPEVLDQCDRLGMLVIDEAFDMWRKPKVRNGSSRYFDSWGETDLRDMIRRDRNHPSVALYSIGNEVLEQTDPEGWRIARRLTEICHDEDRSRPVTAAFNEADQAIKNGLVREVDIPGFNYQASHYEQLLREIPDRAIFGSETGSCVSSRGVYHLPLLKYDKHPSLQITSYDIIAPRWGYPPDVEFEAQERLPGVLGEFVWTGFDYLGEPTPYFWTLPGAKQDEADWPARSSYFGIMDLAGFPKDRYFLYQSVWTKRPMVHLLPHWNWAGHEGQAVPVMVYTNGDEAELFVNGRSLGRQQRGASPVELPVGRRVNPDGKFLSSYRLLWQVPYEGGALRAEAYTAGKLVASTEVHTAGAPARLRVSTDRTTLRADEQDLAFLSVRVEDKDGNLCPFADNLVRFRAEGAGHIAGVDNGNPATVEPFQANQRLAFGGLCEVLVRPNRDERGPIRVESTSEGLEPAETDLTAVAK
jgi:beta-galactosidase